MQHWIEYLRNEENKMVVTHAHGLIAFQVAGRELYVTDFYVKPSHRGQGIALDLAKKVEAYAVEKGCVSMSCNIFINEKNRSEFSNKVRLFSTFGFLPSMANNNVITMIKEL